MSVVTGSLSMCLHSDVTLFLINTCEKCSPVKCVSIVPCVYIYTKCVEVLCKEAIECLVLTFRTHLKTHRKRKKHVLHCSVPVVYKHSVLLIPTVVWRKVMQNIGVSHVWALWMCPQKMIEPTISNMWLQFVVFYMSLSCYVSVLL